MNSALRIRSGDICENTPDIATEDIMTRSQRTRSPDNGRYQKSMADSLVACLGLDEAIRASAANRWDGVLDILMKLHRARIC